MQTVYRLKTEELDTQFLESLKMLFKDRDIEIVVTEVDETSYLLRSEANKKRLLEAIHAVEKGQNLIEVDITKQ
jgi:antitoxin YefM